MLKQSQLIRLAFCSALLFALLIPAFTPRPAAQTSGSDQVVPERKYGIEGRYSAEERARELDLWHELNRQRVARLSRGTVAVGAEAPVIDLNDVSVIEDDGTLAAPQNPFDLNGSAVLFTPSGAAYSFSNSAAAFDANLGTKLNLTAPPAFNPGNAEPGDDAYILQDLGFSLSLYGTSYTQVAVSSNGFLTFRPAGVSDTFFNNNSIDAGESLTDLQTTLPRIAPYWHDLDARASATTGDAGIYLRRDNDRVVVTWNNIRDFPNSSASNGVHRFQVTLFNDGRILFAYDSARLTSTALVGLSPGNSAQLPTLVDLRNPPPTAVSGPLAEFFTLVATVDLNAIVRAFYLAHPNQDVYDFVYFLTDFNFDLGGGAFAFYRGLFNDATGIGQTPFNSATRQFVGSQRIQGLLNLNNLITAYPALPSERMINIGGVDDALSLFAQEQGHRWLARAQYPGSDPNLLLGRSNSHWNYFFSIESSLSSPAARRSSALEGSVWRDNGDGTFTTVNLIDGFSQLDQYLMGLRPPSEVPDMFIINNPVGTNRTRSSNPLPNVTVSGARQNITINEVIQATGVRNPSSATAPKNFRAAFILFVRRGTQPAPATLAKLTLFRLAWESYFAQATDYLASIQTGLAAQSVSRVIAAASAASYARTLAPAEITALFGADLAGSTAAATAQPLPTTLAGVQVRVNGTLAPLFFVSPRQINFQIPRLTPATTNNSFASVPSGAVTIEVLRDGQLTRAGVFQIAPAVPGIFTLTLNGAGPAVAVDAFTFTGPPFAARRSNGEPNVIAVFGTGLGADATDVEGNVNASVQATINGQAATVLYAGRVSGLVGLNQYNVMLPAGITAGTHTLVISRNGVASNPTTIAIR